MTIRFQTPLDIETPKTNDELSAQLGRNFRDTRKDLEKINDSISSGGSKTVRNTVMCGKTTSGVPSALAAGSGLSVDMDNSTASVVSFAAGFSGQGGEVNYSEELTANQSFSSLTPFATPYLFLERTGAGAVSTGHSTHRPLYDTVFTGARIGSICADFEDFLTATTYTDKKNNVFSFSAANCTVQTGGTPYGTYCLRMAGTNGYCQTPMPLVTNKWTLHLRFKCDNIATSQAIFFGSEIYTIALQVNSSKLYIAFSSNNSSYNIANGVAGTATLSSNTWYHLAVVFDGTAYRFYINGTIDATIASSTAIFAPNNLRFGAANDVSVPMTGYIDNIEWLPYAKWTENFTAPTTVYNESIYYYNINDAKMYYGTPASWAAKNIVFNGRCQTGRATTDGNITSPGIARGGTATQVQFSAFYYQIAQLGYYKPAVSGQALTATTVPTGKWALFGWEIGTDGTIHSKDASGNATGYATEALALAAIPAPTASHVLFAYITVMKSDGNFAGATTALNAANVTCNYYNSALLAAAVSDVVTFAYNRTYRSEWFYAAGSVSGVTYAKNHNLGISHDLCHVEVYLSTDSAGVNSLRITDLWLVPTTYYGKLIKMASDVSISLYFVDYLGYKPNGTNWTATGYLRVVVRGTF